MTPGDIKMSNEKVLPLLAEGEYNRGLYHRTPRMKVRYR